MGDVVDVRLRVSAASDGVGQLRNLTSAESEWLRAVGPVELVEAAFNQRRKMLRRSLAARLRPEAFEQAGIDPADRPERLSVQDWGRLTHAVAELGPPAP